MRAAGASMWSAWTAGPTAYVEYANPEEQEEAERRSAALWNMGKVIHMRPGE